MRVYEAIAGELARQGVRVTFSVPANEIMHALIEAQAHGIAIHRTRHEHAAIGMADGYARLSGQVGVALVGKGPGLTNGINALVTARKAGSPVLLLAGEAFSSPATDPHIAAGETVGKKSIDQQGFLAALGIPSVTLASPSSATADFAAAFELTKRGGALAVLVPEDVIRAEAGAEESRVPAPVRTSSVQAQASQDEIGAIADLLQESWVASRPVILAGRGAVNSGARDELIRIGDAVGALYSTSLAAKGLFANDAWNLGVAGTMSSPAASELLSRSDLVLVFGASLGPFTTMAGDLFRRARVVRVDDDPRMLDGANDQCVPVLGDARVVAAQLAAELSRRGVRRTGYRTEHALELIDESAPADSDVVALLAGIDEVLPVPRTLVIDAGAHLAVSGRCLSASDPSGLLLPSEYGSLGAGQPIALGACLARPDRATVLALGDGAFMMTLADIDTAVRYGLQLIVLVMNNGGFAAEYQNLQLDGAPVDLSLYANPDFAAVARALGADGISVAGPEDLAGLRERLEGRSRPVVVDVKVPIDAESDWVGVSHRMHTAVGRG